MDQRRRTAAIIATHGGLFDELVESAGFEVVGIASTAVFGERLIAFTHPDLVVVENELPGEQGIDDLVRLRDASPASEFVLIVADELVAVDTGRPDAYAVLTRGRLVELPELLGVLCSRLGERRVRTTDRTERRSGMDRRCRQNWAKVGWEKRRSDRRREPTNAL